MRLLELGPGTFSIFWITACEVPTIVASSVCVQPSSLRRRRSRPPRVVGSGDLLLLWVFVCMSLTAFG